MISIIQSSSLKYPPLREFICQLDAQVNTHGIFSDKKNPVQDAVRDLFLQVGLDQENGSTPEWNPLVRFITPGSQVFVLCNFVYHRRPNETERDFFAKCAHGSVLHAVLEYCVRTAGAKGKVLFGNSPLQSCNRESVLADTGAARIVEYCKEKALPVAPKDLRLFMAEHTSSLI